MKTILELDLVGYSSVIRMLEESAGAGMAAILNSQVQAFVDKGLAVVGAAREETVIHTTGDGAILAFDRAADAHCFAEVVQLATRRHNMGRTEASAKRLFRMGAATGDVAMTPKPGGGFEAAGVTIANAVRLEQAAHPGELLVDAATFNALPAELREAYGEEEIVAGKRDERFSARRTAFGVAPQTTHPVPPLPPEPLPPSTAPSTPPADPPVADIEPAVAAGEEGASVSGKRLVLVYKRSAAPDERILHLLETGLRKLGHDVFIDRHMTIGVEWAKEIERRIREADAVIPLLSAVSVHSEMMTYEVQVAHEAARHSGGRPRLLPVRVNLEDPLPHDLASHLNSLQYFNWTSPADDAALIQSVHQALVMPPQPAVDAKQLEAVGGAVPLASKFYVVRPTDEEFRTAIARQDTIVLVKGARQMGKTSLLARGLQQAREAGVKTVFTDFQKFGANELQSSRSFYTAMLESLADQLDLDLDVAAKWNEKRAPNQNFERLVRREILAVIKGPLVWGLDEVDRLFTCDFGGDVFALFRTWHNERALDPTGPFSRLTLCIAYATEAHLFITDINQSPFNVGTRLTLEDFDAEQVNALNVLYGRPLAEGPLIDRFTQLVGGQPFLVRRGLHEMTMKNMRLDDFEARADRDDGPYGDHLRRLLVMIAKDPHLCDVMRGVLRQGGCPDPESFYRLRSAGVVVGAEPRAARPRCRIYQTYLQKHLL